MRRRGALAVLWLLVLGHALACGGGGGGDGPPDTSPDGPLDASLDTGPPPVDAGPPDGSRELCVPVPDAGPPPVPPPLARDPLPRLDCGAPTVAEGTGLRRWPYLQSVTPTSVRVAWTTTTGGAGAVRVAPGPDGPWTEVDAAEEPFDTARTGDAEDYVAYDVTLEGLEDGGVYCYEVVEDGVVLASGLSLRTAFTDPGRQVSFVAFGDSGRASPEQIALYEAFDARMEYDLFLHLGDMAYSDGTFPEFERTMFQVYQGFLHGTPSFPTMGNHEFSTDRGQPYLDVYYLFEQALRAQDQERYYSFDYGDVHFVSLDSNEETLLRIALDRRGAMTDDMVDWLLDDLGSSDAPWKIAIFHHPPYTSSERGPSGLVQSQLLAVLEAGGVDLVLSGHDHFYERSVPIRANCEVAAADRDGVTYIVAGAGGTGLTATTGDWFTAAKEDRVHTAVTATIDGCWAHLETIDLEGEVVDSFALYGCED